MSDSLIPSKLALRRDVDLTVVWPDGRSSVYPLRYLRAKCPCASCKTLREKQAKSRLTVLPTTADTGPLRVVKAEMVGNYALRIDWSDNHGSGIYSFSYLSEIAPPQS
jgi:DUF971 family protein